MITSNRQINAIRVNFFRAILRQDATFHDRFSAAELNNRLLTDVDKIQAGIGDKVGIAQQSTMQLIGGIAIGLFYGWKMALVVLACFPLLAFSGFIFVTIMVRLSDREMSAYAKAGAIATEVFSSIRTVFSFNGQKKELKRYCENLNEAKKVGILKGISVGLSIGNLYLVLFGVYAVSFWYGANLVQEHENTIGQVLTTFFAIVVGAFGMSQIGQNMEYFATAQAAATAVFSIIDREPEIDAESDGGYIPTLDDYKGVIKFENVSFAYPSRPDQLVLRNATFELSTNKTTAICGQSGCGKSTCVKLIQRLYDPLSGKITIDGRDVREYNTKWLRTVIGVVAQEPSLFDTSVRENLRMGRLDVTDEEIIQALQKANAYQFVRALPEKLDTRLGLASLSGGQKQRLAIARALVRNPKILLLDEATSALDTESERLVQEALERVQADGLTTLIIAHRLSTIKNADQIIGMAGMGKIVERGNHEQLMKMDGIYANLCRLQTFVKPTEDLEDEVGVDSIFIFI